MTRKGNEVTASYPDIVAGLAGAMPAGSGESVTLDGEIVVLDRSGRPNFGLSQTRMNLAAAEARVPAHFLLFDIIERNGLLPLDQAYDSRCSVLGARCSVLVDHGETHAHRGGRDWRMAPRHR